MTVTSTSTDDTFPLPHFEDRLWQELERRHPSAAGGSGGSGGSGEGGRRRRPGGRSLAAIIALGAAAAILAVGVLVVTGGDGADDRIDTSGRGSVDAPDAVVRIEHPGRRGGRETEWIDEGTGRHHSVSTDAAGDVESESAWSPPEPNPDGSATVSVLHILHKSESVLPTSFRYRRDQIPPNFGQDDLLRSLAASGDVREDGFESIGGQMLLRLVPVGRTRSDVYWVEPDTYRPIRKLTHVGPNLRNRQIDTYTYLDRTAENLDLVAAPNVPDDYRTIEPNVPVAP
jgi:hypothetical protein